MYYQEENTYNQYPQQDEYRQQPAPGVGAQFFPGFPGFPGVPGPDLAGRVRRLETEMDRVHRRIDTLERRVRRLEGGFSPWR